MAALDLREDLSLSEMAYRALRQDIMAGVFAPGQALRLEALKTRYGLSFSPLREALNRLHSERLVESGHGFLVARLSVEDIRDATEVRVLIECEALAQSLAAADDEWEATVVARFHALELQYKRVAAGAVAVPSPDGDVLEERHKDFHVALISKSPSPRLLVMADQLYAEAQRYRWTMLYGQPVANVARDVLTEHREIMEAALARDTRRACALLAEHYRLTAELICLTLEGARDKDEAAPVRRRRGAAALSR